MVYSIEGILVEKTPAQAVIEVQGVAYLMNISLATYEQLGQIGSPVKLFTHVYVREETIDLYGFATKDEKKLFSLLITIPGIGPKVAMRILSGISPAHLHQAVIREDVSFLTRVPGIGKKLGERLVVELKEQMRKVSISEEVDQEKPEVFADAVDALVVLGYRRNQAVSVINTVVKERKGEKLSVEALIKEALKRI